MNRIIASILLLPSLIMAMENTDLIKAQDSVPLIFSDMPQGIKAYLHALPKIPQGAYDAAQKSKVITDYLVTMGGYASDINGRNVVEAKILSAIEQGKPIKRCMPGFPVSSTNPDKVPYDDQHAFGLGDLVALLTRYHISKQISAIHAPGATVDIYFEPYIHDMNQVCHNALNVPHSTPERIETYQHTLADMVSHLEPYVCLGKVDEKQYRDQYACLDVQIDDQKMRHYQTFLREEFDHPALLEQAERIKSYALFAKYPFLARACGKVDYLDAHKQKMNVVKTELSARKYLNDVADQVAECVHVGSQHMALYMKNEIPNYQEYIRESVNGDSRDVSKKIKTSMIYGAKGTPWHNVLAVTSDGITLASYKELLKKGCKEIKYCTIDGHQLPYVEA